MADRESFVSVEKSNHRRIGGPREVEDQDEGEKVESGAESLSTTGKSQAHSGTLGRSSPAQRSFVSPPAPAQERGPRNAGRFRPPSGVTPSDAGNAWRSAWWSRAFPSEGTSQDTFLPRLPWNLPHRNGPRNPTPKSQMGLPHRSRRRLLPPETLSSGHPGEPSRES